MSAYEQLAQAGVRFASAGLSPGTSGNLSVRIGARTFMTASGVSLGRIRPVDIVELDAQGRVVDGSATPSKEAGMHRAAYRSRPDATAIVHLHAPASTAVSCLPVADGADPLPAYTPYRIRRLGRVRLVDYAPPGSSRLAGFVAEALRDCPVVLLANHGSLVCAESLTEAVEVVEELEAAAVLTLALAGTAARTLDASTAWTDEG